MALTQVETLTCDLCGNIAEDTVTFRVDGANIQIDICGKDLADLRKKGRKPRRGRKPKRMAA